MKLVAGVVALGLAVGVFGCSSGSGDDPLGPDPDLAEVESHFQNPDGTFNEGNAQKVLNGQGAASELNFTGTSTGSSSSGSSSKQSINLLDANDSGIVCDALQQGQESGTCTCPEGGTFSYAVRTERVDQVTDVFMKVRMNACTVRGGTIDGRQYMKMHLDQAAEDKLGLSMLSVIDATISKDGQTHSIAIEQRIENKVIEIAVRVDDGWVSVRYESSNTSSGKLVVKDRRGTWTCVATNGHGECTNDKGETQKF